MLDVNFAQQTYLAERARAKLDAAGWVAGVQHTAQVAVVADNAGRILASAHRQHVHVSIDQVLDRVVERVLGAPLDEWPLATRIKAPLPAAADAPAPCTCGKPRAAHLASLHA